MKARTASILTILAATLLISDQWAEARSRNMDFDMFVRIKNERLQTFAADYDIAISIADKAYLEKLEEIQKNAASERIRSVAQTEAERFAASRNVPKEDASNLPDEIRAARKEFRAANEQADQTRLRRTIGLLDAHIRQIQSLHDVLRSSNPDDPMIPEIIKELDHTRRARAALFPKSE